MDLLLSYWATRTRGVTLRPPPPAHIRPILSHCVSCRSGPIAPTCLDRHWTPPRPPHTRPLPSLLHLREPPTPFPPTPSPVLPQDLCRGGSSPFAWNSLTGLRSNITSSRKRSLTSCPRQAS